jgi:hypothetical protein
MGLTMTDRIKRAREAYMNILFEPIKEGESYFCPPPTEMKDKKWSQILRSYWPDYTSIKLETKATDNERVKWCQENTKFYWTAGCRTVWYFSRRVDAIAFKLRFGGKVI